MRFSIYQDPRGNSIGGSDFCVAVLARRLIDLGHSVQLAHYQDSSYLANLESAFQLKLPHVEQVFLPMADRCHVPDVPLLKRSSSMRDWMRNVSLGADGFVCMTHSAPPFNYARRGVVFVHFPFRIDNNEEKNNWKSYLSRLFYRKLWNARMKSYTTVASNSQFTRKWTKQYWQVDSEVIHPPVNLSPSQDSRKEKRIVVLGRFSPAKKQLDLVQLFLGNRHLMPEWKLICIGTKERDCEYYRKIQGLADSSVLLLPNASRSEMQDELTRASLFWHAMGLDVDENTNPLLIEHFGIATVEAMSAGCIPITVSKGGQREIVEHGINGFLCDSLEDYINYSVQIDRDPKLASDLKRAAESSVERFARVHFEDKLLARLGL